VERTGRDRRNVDRDNSIYRFGVFSISLAERRLTRGVDTIALAPQAFDALSLLLRKQGGLVAKSDFMTALWPGVHVAESNLTNIIGHLRRLLGRESIETVSKFGYRFTLPITGQPGITQQTSAAFIRGRDLMAERSLDSIIQARDLFTTCIAEDPQFATGWAWLGRTTRLLQKFRSGQPSAASVAEAAFRRAFAIDPDLACAHNFYTQLQVDMGEGLQALTRLATRLKHRGDDPETLTGLVQVLRCCGLLDQSVAAHERAMALDPTTKTSVAHTAFLRGDYAEIFATYLSKGYYLDAAGWAALGQPDRAATLLRTRLEQRELGPLMSALMASLLAALEGRLADAVKLADNAELVREPEGLFYFARHSGMLNDAPSTIDLIRRARQAGFWSSQSLQRDTVFQSIRNHPDFQSEIHEAQRLEAHSLKALTEILGHPFT
jgi:DNA-binding winged helix-turn-helix (wHTH) protein